MNTYPSTSNMINTWDTSKRRALRIVALFATGSIVLRVSWRLLMVDGGADVLMGMAPQRLWFELARYAVSGAAMGLVFIALALFRNRTPVHGRSGDRRVPTQ